MQIIIAEDDHDDRVLIEDALLENGIDAKVTTFVKDGEELMELLNATKKLPSIILLDLNMPKKDGRQTLVEIRDDARLKHIPIIIYTTSQAEEDIKLSYKHGSNTYFTKPSKFSELVELIASIKSYWFDNAKLGKEK
ncbi:response regulator [Fulvivirga sp. RKSG066]|uniref:response regulator n=1 Tax=Fulvivirga aurantia TaxID=2529383 RepID=UPI0012BD6F5D|nr:response regulator [Fulvivirga aurantia]MTI21621.1 response regulator [Fulvivirga aurantia]